MISRRDCLRLALAPGLVVAACGRRKSPRYHGYALVANHDSRTIAVINLLELRLLTEVPLRFAPSWIFVGANQLAPVLSQGSPLIEILDLDRMTVTSRANIASKAVAARLSKDGNSLWVVGAEPEALIQFRLDSGRVAARVPLPARAAQLDISASAVALSMPDSRRVALYSFSDRRLSVSDDISAAPRLIAFRPDGRILLTGNTEDRCLTVLNASGLQRMVDLPLPLAPRHFCFNADGGQLFVTGDGMDAVTIVGPYQTEIDETILAGHAPANMAATTQDPQYLFLSNPQSGEVTVINIDNRHVLAQISVGEKPGAIVLTPDNEYALVLNEESGDVAVIKLLNIRQANIISRRSRVAPLFTMIPVGRRPVSAAIAPQSG